MKQRDRLIFDDDLLTSLATTFEETTSERLRRLDFVKHCVNELQGRSLELCDLRYGQNLKPAAIAKSLGMTANTVAKALQRIREQLQSCIERKAAASEGAL